MTAGTAMRSMRLQGDPGRGRTWVLALALGVPTVVIAAGIGITLVRGAPVQPALLAGVFAIGVGMIATLWILRALKRISVSMDATTLVVDCGIVTRRFPLATLRAGGLGVVNLAERTELRPILRTWGIGMPGLSSGRFRLRNGEKALCVLTGRERVTVLRADDGTSVLLSLADPAPLRAAIERS